MDALSWLRAAGSAFGLLRSFITRRPAGQRPLIFIEQGGRWSYIQPPGGGAIQVQSLLHVTNEREDEAIIITRVRLRRAGLWHWLRRSDWRDCARAEFGDQLFLPMLVGPPLPARTTTVMRILHAHRAARPNPGKAVMFVLEVWDQRRKRHRTRLTCEPMASG